MNRIKTFFTLCVLLTLLEVHQCGRTGGSPENAEKFEVEPILSVDEPKGPPLPALAYRTTARSIRTTARHTTPRATTRRSSTTRHITTPRSTTRHTTTRHTTSARLTTKTTPLWVDLKTQHTRRSTTARPTTRHTTTSRYTTRHTTTPRPTTRHTTTTRSTTKPTPRWVDLNTRKTTTKRITTRRYTTPKPIYPKQEYTYQNLPPVPGSGKPGKTKVVIKNTYNYHYPGFYTIPVAHHEHPGYYRTYTSYSYTPTDTGDSLLGFYVGYKLAKLTTPTFSHQSFYDGYRPRYDHYTVHHYYHNSDSVPKQQTLVANAIVGCVGDSVTVCPSGTTSLCTADGTLMCVVSATNVVDCTDTNNRPTKCLRSTISCENNDANECKGTNMTSVSVNIPCVSTAKIEGNITYVNNTIVKSTAEITKSINRNESIHNENCTRITPCANNTSPECTNRVNTTCIQGSTKYVDGTYCVANMSCINNTAAECLNKTSITVNVTCLPQNISTYCAATVPCVNISSPDCANRTNITINATCIEKHITHANGSTSNVTSCTGAIPCVNNTSPDCVKVINVTCDFNSTLQEEMRYVNNPLTEDVPTTTPPPTSTSGEYWKWKRSVPGPEISQNFCVSVVAVPARRKSTDGEEFLNDAKSILSKFVESAWNL